VGGGVWEEACGRKWVGGLQKVLRHVHSEDTDVTSVDFLKGDEDARIIGEIVGIVRVALLHERECGEGVAPRRDDAHDEPVEDDAVLAHFLRRGGGVRGEW
jgi:hypothetical protein